MSVNGLSNFVSNITDARFWNERYQNYAVTIANFIQNKIDCILIPVPVQNGDAVSFLNEDGEVVAKIYSNGDIQITNGGYESWFVIEDVLFGEVLESRAEDSSQEVLASYEPEPQPETDYETSASDESLEVGRTIEFTPSEGFVYSSSESIPDDRLAVANSAKRFAPESPVKVETRPAPEQTKVADAQPAQAQQNTQPLTEEPKQPVETSVAVVTEKTEEKAAETIVTAADAQGAGQTSNVPSGTVQSVPTGEVQLAQTILSENDQGVIAGGNFILATTSSYDSFESGEAGHTTESFAFELGQQSGKCVQLSAEGAFICMMNNAEQAKVEGKEVAAVRKRINEEILHSAQRGKNGELADLGRKHGHGAVRAVSDAKNILSESSDNRRHVARGGKKKAERHSDSPNVSGGTNTQVDGSGSPVASGVVVGSPSPAIALTTAGGAGSSSTPTKQETEIGSRVTFANLQKDAGEEGKGGQRDGNEEEEQPEFSDFDDNLSDETIV